VKPTHAIPPAAALVAALLWNLPPWRAVQALEANSLSLRERIDAARVPAAREVRETREASSQESDAAREAKPIDWRYLAAQARLSAKPNSSEPADEQALYDFSERLAEMTREQLLTALGEIAALGLEPEVRAMLEAAFVEPLVEKDPQLALTRFADRIRDDPDDLGSELSPALLAWAKQDLTAATAWFDQAIASGVFESKTLDGRSDPRLEFEAALAGVLLATDPAAVGRRIAELPADQRAETLQQITVSELTPAAQKEYIELTRSLLPVDEREGPFASAFSEVIPDGDYQKSAAFLDDIQATPEERAIAAEWAAGNRLEAIAEKRNVTRDDVAATREWLTRQSPDTADRLMGEAMGSASMEGGEVGYAKLVELVLEVQASSGNDDTLVAFLERSDASGNPEKSKQLAEKITDPQRREEALEYIK
jgi:DNA-binding CsgD family transcriptional regulator